MNINGTSYLRILFAAQTELPWAEGQLAYDDDEQALIFDNAESGIRLQIGQEQWIMVRNDSGDDISDGKAVYLDSAVGHLPAIKLAKADAIDTSRCVGLTTHAIENNSNGFVTINGVVRGIDTANGFSDGDEIYLSPDTAGLFTNVKPEPPNYVSRIGIIAYSHGTEGKVLVDTDHHGSMSEIVQDKHGGNKQTLTLGAAATTLAVTANFLVLTGDVGGNTLATITGGIAGQRLTILFTDGNVTITDNDAHDANSVDLSAAFTSADDTILDLIFDGNSWYERSRSVN